MICPPRSWKFCTARNRISLRYCFPMEKSKRSITSFESSILVAFLSWAPLPMRLVWHGEGREANLTYPGPTTVSPRGTRLISKGHPEDEEDEEKDDKSDDVDEEDFGPEEKLIHDLLPLQSEMRSLSLSGIASPNRRSFPSQQERQEHLPYE